MFTFKTSQSVGEPIEYVYFPCRAVVSCLSTMNDGSMVEVCLVGNDGIVGIPAALGDNIATTTATVQIPDSAMRMKASLLKTEFNGVVYCKVCCCGTRKRCTP